MEKTHYKKLQNPNYIGSYELMTGGEPIELDVKIIDVGKELVQNGNKQEECLVIRLEKQKPMILNSTNSKSVAKAIGSPFVEDWIGKKITLYVEKVKAFGDIVDALRVRELPVVPFDVSKIIKLTDVEEVKKIANENFKLMTGAQKKIIRNHITNLSDVQS